MCFDAISYFDLKIEGNVTMKKRFVFTWKYFLPVIFFSYALIQTIPL